MATKCPDCGANAVIEGIEEVHVTAPFGSVEILAEKYCACDECGYEADDDPDGNTFLDLYKHSTANSVPIILERLQKQGYSLVTIERVLGLPFRTLSRWKTEKKVSAAGLALLRMLAVCPWLLDVADHDYKEDPSDIILMNEGVAAFHRYLGRHNENGFHILQSGPNMVVSAFIGTDYSQTLSIPEYQVTTPDKLESSTS